MSEWAEYGFLGRVSRPLGIGQPLPVGKKIQGEGGSMKGKVGVGWGV